MHHIRKFYYSSFRPNFIPLSLDVHSLSSQSKYILILESLLLLRQNYDYRHMNLCVGVSLQLAVYMFHFFGTRHNANGSPSVRRIGYAIRSHYRL